MPKLSEEEIEKMNQVEAIQSLLAPIVRKSIEEYGAGITKYALQLICLRLHTRIVKEKQNDYRLHR